MPLASASPGQRRLLQNMATAPSVPNAYDNVFPTQITDHLSNAYVWLIPLVPALIMFPLVVLPALWLGGCKGQKKKMAVEELFDTYSPRSRGSISFYTHRESIDERDPAIMQVPSSPPPPPGGMYWNG